jgi:hypothetical protein
VLGERAAAVAAGANREKRADGRHAAAGKREIEKIVGRSGPCFNIR